MKELYELVTNSGAMGVFVAFLFLLPVLAKALFALKRSHSQDRKDFLELWATQKDKADDLWLEVCVRHISGKFLPADLIRKLLKQPEPARAIFTLSKFWGYLEYDKKPNGLRWRNKRHEKKINRTVEVSFFYILYTVLGVFAYFSVNGLVDGKHASLSIIQYSWAFSFVVFAFACLARAESLDSASRNVPKWLTR